MAVPKKRRSVARRGSRHGSPAYKLTTRTVIRCNNCDAPMLPHKACSNCGFYKGQEVFKVKTAKEEE